MAAAAALTLPPDNDAKIVRLSRLPGAVTECGSVEEGLTAGLGYNADVTMAVLPEEPVRLWPVTKR